MNATSLDEESACCSFQSSSSNVPSKTSSRKRKADDRPETPVELSYLEQLPTELFDKILRLLDVRGVHSLACTNRNLSQCVITLNVPLLFDVFSATLTPTEVRFCRNVYNDYYIPADVWRGPESKDQSAVTVRGRRLRDKEETIYDMSFKSFLPERFEGILLEPESHLRIELGTCCRWSRSKAPIPTTQLLDNVNLRNGTLVVSVPDVVLIEVDFKFLNRILSSMKPFELHIYGDSALEHLTDEFFASHPSVCSLFLGDGEPDRTQIRMTIGTVIACLDHTIVVKPKKPVSIIVSMLRDDRLLECYKVLYERLSTAASLGLKIRVRIHRVNPGMITKVLVNELRIPIFELSDRIEVRFGAEHERGVVRLCLDSAALEERPIFRPSRQRRELIPHTRIEADLHQLDIEESLLRNQGNRIFTNWAYDMPNRVPPHYYHYETRRMLRNPENVPNYFGLW